ncbi:MAG: restriction endonuclease subunit S [Spirochaetia bacterium]|nr:restriction endonuclease subunit S [Spirochaetia bacterium]
MSNIPKLRFPEFSGEWEKSELGKFTQEITRVNSNSDAPIMMISAANGFILQSNKYSKEMTGQSLKKYIELHAGEFAYNHGASKLKKYGACFCLDLDKARIPFVYHCFKLTEGNTKFFSYLLNRTQLDSELARYISSSARMDGLLNISYTDYMKINISVPTLAEQQKIADFLSNVDSIITTETKILKNLQKKKKALMQKLFTQQLRFKSDDGTDFPEWEEKKLGDVCSYIGGGTPSKKVKEYWNGNINWASVKDITGKYLYETQDKISQLGADSSATNICEPDSLLLITRMSPGKTVITKCITAINQDLKIVKSDINVEFLHLLFQSIQTKIDEKTSGTTVKGISIEGLNQIDIRLPCKAEQQKIADCLSIIDSLIQTQQKVVTTWHQRKKALLQQMFI